MNLSAFALLLAAATASPLEVGVEYRMDGRLAKSRDEDGGSEKRFQIVLFADSEAAGKSQVAYWTLTENGRGQAPWLERFGSCDPFAAGDDLPALYYQRDEGLSIAGLPPFALRLKDPALGKTWSQGARAYEVVGESKVNEQPVWKVVSRDAVGRRRDMKVEKDSGLVVALSQIMFLGQGDRYEVEWAVRRVAGANRLPAAADATRKLIALRDAAGWKRRDERSTLNAGQREKIAKSLAPILKQAANSPLESVVNAARRDLSAQNERAESVASMAKRAIGSTLQKASLQDGSGKQTALSNGRVTVLHFWEYREKPLKDPYGQSAYVDFFYRNRDPEAVDVFGVNVDSRLGIGATRGAALRSAKRFRTFMNLSYPLLMDDGRLLRSLGDPRTTGAKLPLFVVLDPNGKVVSYKAGFYEVDRREGLKELAEAVRAAATVK